MSVLHQLVITIQVENTLVQMLAGCLYVLKKEGCSLVGGHTSEGMECAMGLSVSGVAHPDRVFHKGLRGKQRSSGETWNEIVSAVRSDLTNEIDDHRTVDSINGVTSTEVTDTLQSSLDGSGSGLDSCSSYRGSLNGHLGHVLVLTKALGTGTIMAAHMRAKVSCWHYRTRDTVDWIFLFY